MQHVVEPGRDGLLDDVLDRGLVDDRQHFLRRCLGRGQEPGAQAGGRNDGLGDRLVAVAATVQSSLNSSGAHSMLVRSSNGMYGRREVGEGRAARRGMLAARARRLRSAVAAGAAQRRAAGCPRWRWPAPSRPTTGRDGARYPGPRLCVVEARDVRAAALLRADGDLDWASYEGPDSLVAGPRGLREPGSRGGSRRCRGRMRCWCRRWRSTGPGTGWAGWRQFRPGAGPGGAADPGDRVVYDDELLAASRRAARPAGT